MNLRTIIRWIRYGTLGLAAITVAPTVFRLNERRGGCPEGPLVHHPATHLRAAGGHRFQCPAKVPPPAWGGSDAAPLSEPGPQFAGLRSCGSASFQGWLGPRQGCRRRPGNHRRRRQPAAAGCCPQSREHGNGISQGRGFAPVATHLRRVQRSTRRFPLRWRIWRVWMEPERSRENGLGADGHGFDDVAHRLERTAFQSPPMR